MAKRFVEDWANQDFKSMRDELSDSAQRAVLRRRARLRVSRSPGGRHRDRDRPGRRRRPEERQRHGRRRRTARRADEAVRQRRRRPPAADRRRQGRLGPASDLPRPLSQASGSVGASTLGRRAPILAKHHVPLATGPVDGRSSPAGLRRDRRRRRDGRARRRAAGEAARAGYPTNESTGISGLELAFNPRLSGTPSGELLAVKEGTPLADVPAGTKGRVLATALGAARASR